MTAHVGERPVLDDDGYRPRTCTTSGTWKTTLRRSKRRSRRQRYSSVADSAAVKPAATGADQHMGAAGGAERLSAVS